MVLGIGLAWLCVAKDHKLEFILAAVLAGILAFVMAQIAGKLYYDPRPFVAEHLIPLVSHGADNGFPSDHALFTMTLTAITYFYNKKAATVMLVLTVLVSVARVLARVHSPLDIGAAWLLGVIGAGLGYYLTRWVIGKYGQKSQTNE